MEHFALRFFDKFTGPSRDPPTVRVDSDHVMHIDGRPIQSYLSPVWRIKGSSNSMLHCFSCKSCLLGLDPHQDTPVEILHVILLGFVKYLWRDAIGRLKSREKAVLETRLNGTNVQGLGGSPLAGHTLVTYAGSLTGRDFRMIVQVAPFVLIDLIPQECYNAFGALSALVPLVWQPVIDNLDQYLVRSPVLISSTPDIIDIDITPGCD